MSYRDEVLADAPLWYIRLDELSGSVATDSSGHGRDGVYHSVTLAQTGALAGDADAAASFDGSASYVALPRVFASPITVEAWIKPSNTTQDSKAIGRNTLGTDVNGNLAITGGKYRWEITAGGVYKPLDAVTSLTTSAYVHFVGTYDGTTQKLYINGALDNSQAVSGALGDHATRGWAIGRVNDIDANNFFAGKIDEAALYNTALSLARITAHYNAGVAGRGELAGAVHI